MNINTHIFRAYDIRGIALRDEDFPPPKSIISSDHNCTGYKEDCTEYKKEQKGGDDPVDLPPLDLTPETVYLIGKGAGTYLLEKNGLNIAVGRDNRLSSPVLHEAFMKGLIKVGCNVIDIGLVTSPMMYYSVCKYSYDGGVMITASHNPKEYNGVKIVEKNAHSICGDELQKILKIIQQGDFKKGRGSYSGKDDVFADYKEDIKNLVSLKKPLKIVVDAGNGVAGKYAPELLRAIGCEVTELYCNLDGNFPNHEANPEELDNMLDLISLVRAKKADLGIGFDGDGDRVGIVDENGKHYSADYLLLLLARDVLERQKGAKIVFDVKVSQVLIDDIKKHGGDPVMSKTGHSFIESKMKEIGAPLAGEVSGHLFFAEDYYGFDDAFLGAAKILEIASEHDKSFSHLFDDVPKTFMTPEFKAPCPDDKKFQIIKELTDYFTSNYDCITIDGVRVNFPGMAWGAVRASNTSPNLTLRFEAGSREQLDEIQKIFYEQIKNYSEVGLNWYKG